MSLNAHLQELKKKHANLSATVEEQERSPAVDPLTLRDMKKEKLRLKEEISRLGR
ncbi:YdcH family protein [Rhodobacteraceae bacterium N5(2021)]|uniref:YdcH family protein n=1 Tax=Gymnodinialimonas phycosphaerae TaxID=2841589 RepID=A0A975YF93_9RHOB|nr:YdcH family protein [Gymnodinialimonas phycosphaerae]MBY4894571.1 YdcH family protein [Gymnodinialimonas phycosphaerae]